jgi:hypothetical protein
VLVFRGIHEGRKSVAVSGNAWSFSLFSAVFAVNYQPSTFRLPRKSWAFGGFGERKKSEAAAVVSLFSAAFIRDGEKGEGRTADRNHLSASIDEIRMTAGISQD